MKGLIGILILAASLAIAVLFFSCQGGTEAASDDDASTSNQDKQTVLCNKIESCKFETALGITDCKTWAKDLSEWLVHCGDVASSCDDLADCFNLNN